jgi:glycosyltransferase involved in cell wall biosynthesis
MDVSVLICTWNNSRRLAITLGALGRCQIPEGLEWEVVVVNNNCTDDTDECIRQFASSLPIVHVHEPQQGLSRARNAGLAAATGSLILFTDDDVKPAPAWVAGYWNAFQEKRSGFYFGGPLRSEFEGTKPDAELLSLAPPSVRGLELGTSPTTLESRQFFVGPNWACPADVLRKVGAFDVRKGLDPSSGKVLVGEETDLMNRLNESGLRGWYLPESGVIHMVPAEKCSLEHVADRAEAHRFNQISNSPGIQARGHIIFGAPQWTYRATAMAWVKWLWARARGKPAYREYVEFREMVGTIRGFRARTSAAK